MSAGQLFFSMRGVKQDQELHRKELATSMATHFQTLSQDLFAAAKEADRDVWEQNNDRFNNLMIITVLMLGITSSLVTDGSFNASNASQDFELAFLITTSAALAFYFGSLSAAIRATRDMSVLMTDRSARLERRIIQLTSQNGGLSENMGRLYASRGLSIARQHCSPGPAPATAPASGTGSSSRDEADPGLVEGENESFNTFVEWKIKPLEMLARNFFLMGTLCSMVAMAMLVSTDFSSVGAKMCAVISVVGGFTIASLTWCAPPHIWTWCAPPHNINDNELDDLPTNDQLKEEVRDASREPMPRCEVPLL